jgi:hypothetical protein
VQPDREHRDQEVERVVLLGAAGAFAVLGPVAVLGARSVQPEWFVGPIPPWNEFGHVARDLVISGTYPTVVWAAPLLAGMWIGRQKLSSARLPVLLLVGGAALAGLSYAARGVLAGLFSEATSRSEWRQLFAIVPHNDMPLWVISSTAIAVAVVGGAILLARAVPRMTWPVVAMGQTALTIYVLHLFVLAERPEWLRRETFEAAWGLAGRFVLIAVVLATLWRVFAPRGPIELLLHLPWWWRDRRRVGSEQPALRPGPETTTALAPAVSGAAAVASLPARPPTWRESLVESRAGHASPLPGES